MLKNFNTSLFRNNLVLILLFLAVSFIAIQLVRFSSSYSDNSEEIAINEPIDWLDNGIDGALDDLALDDLAPDSNSSNSSNSGNVCDKFPKNKKVVIQRGDTLLKILLKENLESKDIQTIITLAQKAQIASKLSIGKTIFFDYIPSANNKKAVLNKVTITMDKLNSMQFVRSGDSFSFNEVTVPLEKFLTKYDTVIDSSLISSLKSMHLSDSTVSQIIQNYSSKINFHRNIKPGDKITVIVEKFVTPNGEMSHTGNVLYSSLRSNKRDHDIYYYNNAGNDDYKFFDSNGRTIKKGDLLGNPLKVIKVSSPFGYRKHPVLGYRKFHGGVDLVAPKNTPIYAAADGIVTFVGNGGGYGNTVKIKHSQKLSTLYAHATRFATSLKNGSKVKKGDIIAYVGSTGRATAPHLHYEVQVNSKQVNPAKFRPTSDFVLTREKLQNFKKLKLELESLKSRFNNEDIQDIPFKDLNISKYIVNI